MNENLLLKLFKVFLLLAAVALYVALCVVAPVGYGLVRPGCRHCTVVVWRCAPVGR